MELFTPREFIKKTETGLEIWGSRYHFESWVVEPDKAYKDSRTDITYNSGDRIFTLIGYLDDDGKYVFVNEKQYFYELY